MYGKSRMNSLQKEHITKETLQKLIGRMKEIGYKSFKMSRLKGMVNELQRKGVYGVDKFIQKLLDSVNNEKTYADILKEGRFAIILARNGFSGVTFIEEDKKHKLPDIKANYNRSEVYFEVTRKRSKVDEWAEQPEDVELPSAEPEDIISKIQRKMGQLIDDKINILVFWSDTLAVDKLDMKEAFEYIQQEIGQGGGVYKKLSGILFFDEGGFSIPTMKQCYLFKNEKALKPIGLRLSRRLDCLNEKSPNQLKRERERWTAILEDTRGRHKSVSESDF